MSSDTLKIILLIKLLYLSSRLYFYEIIGIINPFGKLSEQKKELPCKHESEVNKGRQGKASFLESVVYCSLFYY